MRLFNLKRTASMPNINSSQLQVFRQASTPASDLPTTPGMFGGYLRDTIDRETGASQFVVWCVNAIETTGDNLKSEALYGASGNQAKVQEIVATSEHDMWGKLCKEDNVNVLTGALKLYFRQLQRPLMEYSDFKRAFQAKDPIKETRLLVGGLPAAERKTLVFLMHHLQKVLEQQAANKMEIQGVSTVFGTTLMELDIGCSMQSRKDIIEFLLTECESIFPKCQLDSVDYSHKSATLDIARRRSESRDSDSDLKPSVKPAAGNLGKLRRNSDSSDSDEGQQITDDSSDSDDSFRNRNRKTTSDRYRQSRGFSQSGHQAISKTPRSNTVGGKSASGVENLNATIEKECPSVNVNPQGNLSDQKLLKLQTDLDGMKDEILRKTTNYVEKMTVLKKNFLKHPYFSDKSLALKKKDRTDLLANVSQIARFSLILETALDEVRDDSSMKGIFRVLYEHFKKYYKHYVSYCTGIKGMQETLLRLKEDRGFSMTLTKMENEEDNGSFGLSQFLDIPKERMFQMKLILTRASDSISKKAKEHEPNVSEKIESENCAKALEVVNQICEESNKNLALEEMQDMYDQFVFPDGMVSPLSITSLNEIVKNGKVTKHAEGNGQTGFVESTGFFKWSDIKVWIFLFDHYILIARKKKTKDMTYEIQDFCPTDKAVITTTKHLDNLQKDRDNKYMMVLVLEQNHKNERTELVLSCKEERDRDEWLDKMTSLHIKIGVGASQLYGENLVDNCSGQDLLAHWNVLHSEGDGWKIEDDPQSWAPFPTAQKSCFDTYSASLAKEQTIDLNAKCITPRRMDEEPHILVGEWYSGRYDFNTKYELIVELLNENRMMMTQYIFKEDMPAHKGGKWKHVSHEFRNYGKGVRYVRFTHLGENGCRMTEATVKIKSLSAGDRQTADRPSLDKQVSVTSNIASDTSKQKNTATSDPTFDSSSDEDDRKTDNVKSEPSEESDDDDDKTGLNATKCYICRNDLTKYIPVNGQVYCPSCYEKEVAVKCVKCKKAILSLGLTYADQPWHKECFTCTHCKAELSGTKFTSHDEKPYCMECFGELYAKRCATCRKPIAGVGDSRFVSSGDRDWHNDCFKCTHCRAPLAGRGFFLDADENITCAKCIKIKR